MKSPSNVNNPPDDGPGGSGPKQRPGAVVGNLDKMGAPGFTPRRDGSHAPKNGNRLLVL